MHAAVLQVPGEVQWKHKLRDGSTVLIRPIHGDDVEIERRFIERLSPQAKRFRFLGEIRRRVRRCSSS